MKRKTLPELPISIMQSFDDARALLGRPEVDTQACFPHERPSKAPERDWRLAKFPSMRRTKIPGFTAASCDLFVGYRPSSRIIWSIGFSDASKTLRATLHGVPVNSHLAAIIDILGPPVARHPDLLASLIDVCWWKPGDLGFRASVMREDYHDITGLLRAGDIREFEAFSYSLAPPWHGSTMGNTLGGA